MAVENTISNPGFSDMDPEERLPLCFNFSRDMADLGSALAASPAPVVTATRLNGEEDGSPEAILDGGPFIDGDKVKQWISDPVLGCRYVLRCEAYSESGAKVVLAGTLFIRGK